jgi:hypothetical protein
MLKLLLFALLVIFWILYLIFNKKLWYLVKRVIYCESTLLSNRFTLCCLNVMVKLNY